MNKKSLDEILRISRRVATTSNESVKGWPVRFAKAGKGFPRSFIRIGLASLQYDRPVRRFERRTTFLQGAWNRFRNRAFSLKPLAFTIKIAVRRTIRLLGLLRSLIKVLVISSGVDVDRRSGKIEGCDIVLPGKNDSFGSAISRELQQVAEA
jgi:hypothetical protein